MRKQYITKRIACSAVLACLIFALRGTERIAQEDAHEICQVYCIGDSITYGSGLPEERRAEESYPARLQQLLGAGYEVVNYGVSGRTLLDVPEKCYYDTGYIELVATQSPDILILMLGTNDSKAGNWDAEAYKSRYIELVRELQEIPSTPQIYIMAPPRAYAGEDGKIIYHIDNDIIKNDIHRIVEEVADEMGVEMIDLYAVTADHPEYYADGVHFNSEGYAVLAETVCRVIKSQR